MARGRLISRTLGSSRKFHDLLRVAGKLGEFCQVLYPLIVTNCDEHGRMAGDAFTVKNVVFPSCPRPERDFEAALKAQHAAGLVQRYQVGADTYLQIERFEDHQHLNLTHRGASKFPAPEDGSSLNGDGSATLRTTPPKSALREEKVREGKVREDKLSEGSAARSGREADDLFEDFWAAYPKKKAKDDAKRAWDKRRPNAELLSVMLSALTRQMASPDWNKDSGRYIPYPATWLNKARWTDESDIPCIALVSERTQQNIANAAEALKIIAAGDHRGH